MKVKKTKPFIKKKKRININNKKKRKYDSSVDSVTSYTIYTTTTFFCENKVIESGRKVLSRLIKADRKNNGYFFTYIKKYPLPLTTKKKGRMGKCKGKVAKYVALVSENSELYSVFNVPKLSIINMVRQLQKKLPVNIVYREE